MHAINCSRSQPAVAGVQSPSPSLRQAKQRDTLWYVVRCCSQRGALYAASNYHFRLFTIPSSRSHCQGQSSLVCCASVTFAAVVHPCVVCFFMLYLVSCFVCYIFVLCFVKHSALRMFTSCAESALAVKHCLQMPVYPATLQHIPIPEEESVVLIHGRQLRSTLQNIHRRNYGHNDVKAANVFVSATGEAQLTACTCPSLLCVPCFMNLGY